MSPTFEALGIDRMTVGERIALVQDILDSIAADQPRPLSEAKKAELARRIADADANPDDVVSWDEVEVAALARSAGRVSGGPVAPAQFAQALLAQQSERTA